jgi:uncharacterized protein (DUF1015 family)
MPVIRPFRALRYNPAVAGDIRDLTAPPYDIIYDEWRDRLYERNPYNIIRLIKTKDEQLPGEETAPHSALERTMGTPADKYARAASYLEAWTRAGVLRTDEHPAIYVCADTFEHEGVTRTRWGFIALVRAEEFGKGIHPHERTLSGPKIDRLNLVKATRANLSQIFGIYRDPAGRIGNLFAGIAGAKPDAAFTDELGVGRRMWAIDDPAFIAEVCGFMRDRDIIIADGHHRYETALVYRDHMEPTRTTDDEPFDYVSMYFSSVDDPGMLILPTHRKAGGLNGFQYREFFRGLEREFTVVYPVHTDLAGLLARIREGSAATNVFGVYTGGAFGELRLTRPTVPKALDVDILHDVIIERALGITREDIASGRYLHFSQSPEHVIEDVDRGKDHIGFLMNPIRPEEMFPRVLRGNRMPQKSTYFHPKTLSGLVMYRIDRSSLGE